MAGASAGLPPGLDLRALGKIAAQTIHFFVVDHAGLVRAERANLAPATIPIVVVTLLLGLLSSVGWHFGRYPQVGGHGKAAAVGFWELEGQLVEVARSKIVPGTGGDPRSLRSNSPGGAGAGRLRGIFIARPWIEWCHRVRNQLGRVVLLAVLAVPGSGLEPALDIDLAALPEVLGGPLGERGPSHDPEPLRLFLPFAAGVLVIAVHGNRELGHRLPVGRIPHLWIAAEIADDHRFVERHRAPPAPLGAGFSR